MWPNICLSVLPLLLDFLLPSSANSGVFAPVFPNISRGVWAGVCCIHHRTVQRRFGIWCLLAGGWPRPTGGWLLARGLGYRVCRGVCGVSRGSVLPVSPALAVSAPRFCHCRRLRLRFRAPEGKSLPECFLFSPESVAFTIITLVVVQGNLSCSNPQRKPS